MKWSMAFKGVVVTLSVISVFLVLAVFAGDSYGKEAIVPEGQLIGNYVGDDNTLYMISGADIRAVGADGNLEWTFPLPERWAVCTGFDAKAAFDKDGDVITSISSDGLDVASDGKVLYVYLKQIDEKGWFDHRVNGKLAAISNGKMLWELPLKSRGMGDVDPLGPLANTSGYVGQQYSDAKILARGDRVYVHHDYNETVIGKDGTILWNIANVSDPAAVDDRGFVYLVRSTASQADDPAYLGQAPDHREPSRTIAAYYPNGTLYWERRADDPLMRQSIGDISLPIYENGAIYAPAYNGVTAFEPDGRVKWKKTYDLDEFKFDQPLSGGLSVSPDVKGTLQLYSLMPFDSEGNVYLQCVANTDVPVGVIINDYPMYLIAIGAEGNELSRSYLPANKYVSAKDGIGYATRNTLTYALGYKNSPANVTDLRYDNLFAFDLKSGKELWNFTFRAGDPTVVVLDEASARALLGYNETEQSRPGYIAQKDPILTREGLGIHPGNGTVYIDYQSLNYENPIVFGKSRIAYVGGTYAFSTNGTPLWYEPIDPSYRELQFTQNGTVFYMTPDGKIGVIGIGATAGLTLTALYVFYHFFCAGAVARARARMSKSENRNRILDFIARSPGSTIYEISRGAGLNLGTVKYHMLILGMNHKIASSRMDGKYVRYFTRSNSYSREEQLVLSLMRRDTIGKVLSLILHKPGISNIDIARELDIHESVACRYLKELADKGVVDKHAMETRCSYSVRDAYTSPVAAAIKRFQGQ